MGVYSSSFVIDPKSESALSNITHPSKPNWITAHAIATELSIAEVERLWFRFQQMGANANGILTMENLASPKLSADVFVKNILKYFKSSDGTLSFESYMRGLKWSESQEIVVKARAMFQMLNNGNPIPKEMFQKILRRIYPDETDDEIKRITQVFYRALDPTNQGQIDESNFAHAVESLPRGAVNQIVNFHILPDDMRDKMHKKLPEFSSEAGFYTPSLYESEVPSENTLKEVAEKIHRKDWDMVANRLGFFADDIKTIRTNVPNSTYKQAYQMLLDWKAREGDNAKASTLERSLRSAGMVEASLILAP